MSLRIAALLIACFVLADTQAQRLKIAVSAGGGVSFETGSKNNTDYIPDWGAQLQIEPHIALSKHVYLKTGAGYSRKTAHIRFQYVDDDERRNVYDMYNHYRFLTVPLQVGGNINIHGKERLQVSGGMNYHFLLSGRVDSRVRAYTKNGVMFQDQELSYAPKIFLAPPANRLKATYETGFLLFTPAVYLDAGYLLGSHAAVKAFYEYCLGDIETSYANPGTSRLHYAGVSLGWIF